jgi:two-component system sensor kinase FixL
LSRETRASYRLDPGTVEVRVADNGPGFAGTAMGQMFEPFYTTKAKGMGMGLAVSKTIIEAHKGKLWAEDLPEGGAFLGLKKSGGC